MATASTSSLPIAPPTSYTLTPTIMSSLKPARIFKSGQHNLKGCPYTALTFDDKGDYVLTASTDETMQLFNCKTGKHHKQFYSKKYGVDLVRFTHRSTSILHASTKGDDTIRQLSLHDNNYIRYFKGHKKKVISLEMSPKDDTFLSAAIDDTVRLWDLRSENASGMLNIAGQSSIAYDPASDIFAVTLNIKPSIQLYDLRSYDKQPFQVIYLDDPVRFLERKLPALLTSTKFSNDGKWILVGTSSDVHYVVDAFSFLIIARLVCPTVMGLGRNATEPFLEPSVPNPGVSGNEVSWSPDGRYVISGAIDGKIHIWDVNPPSGTTTSSSADRPPPGPNCTLFPLKSHQGHLSGSSRCVGFNPRSGMLVTGGNDLVFWLPDLPASSGAVV